jgi:hypothetical protein
VEVSAKRQERVWYARGKRLKPGKIPVTKSVRGAPAPPALGGRERKEKNLQRKGSAAQRDSMVHREGKGPQPFARYCIPSSLNLSE